MPLCLASRWRSSLSLLSSRSSTLLSDGQLRNRSDMRSSRSSVAVRSAFSSSSKRLPGRFSIIWDASSQRPQAPAPYGALAGLLPRRRPNHFRILADTLRAICISTSLPPPSAQWPVRSRRKERLGRRNGSRYVANDSERRRCSGARDQRGLRLTPTLLPGPACVLLALRAPKGNRGCRCRQSQDGENRQDQAAHAPPCPDSPRSD